MSSDWMELALACFEPAPPPENLPRIRSELRWIADAYAHNSRSKRLSHAPSRRAEESEADYAARLAAFTPPPPTRGRPRLLGAQLLAWHLRVLLMESGCHYGAPKSEERRSRLEELTEIIHAAVGPPGQRIGWRSIAERMSEPLFQLEVAFGPALVVQGDRSKINEMLISADHRPPKNNRKKN